MRRFALAFTVLVALAGSVSALDFGTVNIEKGYSGPLAAYVTWANGTARDVTNVTGALVVYTVPPVKGVGGTVLFTKAFTADPTPPVLNRLVATVLTTIAVVDGTSTCTGDICVPGSYYAELTLTEGLNIDTLHGFVTVTGR